MTKKKILIKEIEATEGMYLTQADLNEEEERIFVKKLVMSIDSNHLGWIEASEEEKKTHERLMEIYLEKGISL